MKKLLGIFVLGLLIFANQSMASLGKVIQTLTCYRVTASLKWDAKGIINEENLIGIIMDDKVTLIVDAREVDDGSWKGEVLFIDQHGKHEYRLTDIQSQGNKNGTGDIVYELNAVNILNKEYGIINLIYLKIDYDIEGKTFTYDLERVYLKSLDEIYDKDEIIEVYKKNFEVYTANYICNSN